jgi:hypothetical protein
MARHHLEAEVARRRRRLTPRREQEVAMQATERETSSTLV